MITKIFQSFFLSTCWLLLTLIHITCQNQTPPKELSTADSLWQKIVVALENDSLGYKAITHYGYQLKSLSIPEINWVETQMKQHPLWEKSEDLPSTIDLIWTWHYMEKQEDSLAFLHLNNIKSQQIDLLLSSIEIRAQYYYMNYQLDSALYYYSELHQTAKSRDHIPWALHGANNVGTIYFDQRYFQLASTFFTEALEYAQRLKVSVPMLINNIITCALVNSNGHEAKALYAKYEKLFKPTNDYEKAVYQINKIHVLWKSGQIDSFKYQLDQLDVSQLGAAVINMRDNQYLYYYIYKNNKPAFIELFQPYKEAIIRNPKENFMAFMDVLVYAAEQNFPGLSNTEYLSIYNSVKNTDDYPLISGICKVLSFSSNSQSEKDQWKIRHLNAELQIRNANSENFQNNLKNQIRINELFNENETIKNALIVQSAERKIVASILIGTILILMISGISFALYQKNRKITIQKLQLEIQNNRSMHELTQHKKQFAERLISSQDAVNKKLEKIISKLKGISVHKDPEIIQIRKELSSITALNHEWEDELQSVHSHENIQYLYDHFTCLRDFNQTELRLLSYFINGHKTKEIASLLSISEQHVRNTKTKLIKTMSAEQGKTLSYDDLILMQSQKIV